MFGSRSHNYLERVWLSPPIPAKRELQSIATIYADAFAGPPWNEHTRCPRDGVLYGNDRAPGAPSPCCGVALELAYPLDDTIDHIKSELCRPDASLFLLRNGTGEIGGFSWAFSYTNPEEFAVEKYLVPEMQRTVADLLRSKGISSRFYYLSESVIINDPWARECGFGRQFHAHRLGVAAGLGLPAVQRTNCRSPMYRVSQRLGMEQIMGPEVLVDTSARTFTPTGVIINDCLDIENKLRVMFVAMPTA